VATRFEQAVVAILLAVPLACGQGTREVPGPATAGASASAALTVSASAPVDSNGALPPSGGCYPIGSELVGTGLEQLSLVDPEWAPVVEGASPLSRPVLMHGTALDSHVSREDFPSTHVQFDQNTSLLLDPSDSGFLATGNLSGGQPTLELEWETGAYPDWAWAGEGDRVVALGRWIFDCGHPDNGVCAGTSQLCSLDSDCAPGTACQLGTTFQYLSEMHPPQATAVIRTGRGAVLGEEGGAVPATRADIFVSPDGGGAGDLCIVTHKGSLAAILASIDPLDPLRTCFPLHEPLALLPPSAPPLATDFELDVPLPLDGRGPEAIWSIVQRPTPSLSGSSVAAKIEVTPEVHGPDPHLHVRVAMSEPVGDQLPTGFAATLLAGWERPPSPWLEHVRVTVEGITVNSALKPVPLPGLEPPPGWHMEAAVNGEWQQLGGLDTIAAGSERTFFPVNGATYDQYLPRKGTLRLLSSGASEACVDTMFGQPLLATIDRFGGNLGLATACLEALELDAGQVDVSFPGPDFGEGLHEVASDVGAYNLRFRIERLGDEPSLVAGSRP
jgi:hypothetical protein